MLTPRHLVRLLRLMAVACLVLLTILLLGPFQGLEQRVGLNDQAAHTIAFYCVTLGLFAIAPLYRRADLALAALAFGIVIEVVQGLTGRSMSLADVLCDASGILAALAPGMVERLRHHVRYSPDERFANLAARDRRTAGHAGSSLAKGSTPGWTPSTDAPVATIADSGIDAMADRPQPSHRKTG